MAAVTGRTERGVADDPEVDLGSRTGWRVIIEDVCCQLFVRLRAYRPVGRSSCCICLSRH